MRNHIIKSICRIGLFSATLFSIASQAALINRGGGLIYDDVLNITWMQDANFLTGSNSTSNFVNHATATSLLDALVFQGYDDWRLPTIDPENGSAFDFGFSFDGSTDRGFNSQTQFSELAHMFHNNLANTSFFSESGVNMQPGSEIFNSGFTDGLSGLNYSFANIGLSYWTNVANDPINNAAWGFNFRTFGNIATGEQQLLSISSGLGAWAVRDGDVNDTLNVNNPPDPTVGIPEPGSFGLLGFGLAGFLAVRRQNKD